MGAILQGLVCLSTHAHTQHHNAADSSREIPYLYWAGKQLRRGMCLSSAYLAEGINVAIHSCPVMQSPTIT